MTDYLLHLDKSGYPVGVHSEQSSFYFPTEKAAEVYGNAVVHSRGAETSWDEWREQLSEQALSRRARWLPFSDPSTSLRDILMESQASAHYAVG
jgi:hypothetical protein